MIILSSDSTHWRLIPSSTTTEMRTTTMNATLHVCATTYLTAAISFDAMLMNPITTRN
jgi:hypothetical protein